MTLGRKVSVVGAGSGKSVIDGGGRGPQGFVVIDDDALIEGVCISNVCYNFQSSTANGAGVAVSAGAVRSCRITKCWTVGAYQSGAGACVTGGVLADSEIDNCWLDWSYESYGCGVYQTGGVVTNCWIHHNRTPCERGGSGVGVHGGLMTHCLITDNGTTAESEGKRAPQDGSGAYVNGSGILRNCIIRDNLNSTKCAGVALLCGYDSKMAGGTVEHCTIYNNSATTSSIGNSGLIQECGKVINTIVYGNGKNYSSLGSVTLTGGTFATNLIDVANARAVDCVIANPSFVNVATNDFRLKLGSPAIDKGCVREGCETDYAGTARDEKPDLGAYEYVSTGGPLAAGISISQTDYPTGSSPTAEATAEGEDLTDLSYAWYVDGGKTAVSTERTFVWQDAPTGRHSLRLVVKNGGGETSEVLSDNAFDIHPFVTYASTNGASIYPYDAPEKAATNVNDALNAIWSQETESARRVNVAEGTYKLSDTLSLGFAVSLVGAGHDRTLFDASGLAKRALAVLDDNAGASGFEIRGLRNSQITTGNAVYQVGGTIRDIVVNDVKTPVHSVQGIGVAVTGGVFEDSIITNCEASNTHNTFGVALYLSGGTVRNSEIVCNRKTGAFHATDYSVAAYVAGGVLENSRLVGNTSSNRRAGAYMTGGTIRNCLFAGNVGVLEGDALYVPDEALDGVEIVNCTVAANGTSGKTAVYMGKGKLSNSIVFGNAGTNLVKGDKAQVYNSCWPENSSTHDGNLVGAEPRFRSAARGDWRLKRSSPCVDKGTWQALGATKDEVKATKDLRGARRLVGEDVDMGCCENPLDGLMLLVR